jgi:Cof subfamily protein (haloacid dehalogenase superfamily)
MDLSQIKLVATDMDGTLLNSNHEVSDLFFELFKELKKHNILFVAASGRPFYSITEKLNAIKDDIIIVAENGGIVVENNNVLLSTPLAKDNLFEIEELVDSFSHIHPIFCTKNKAYFKNTSDTFIDLLSEYYPTYSVINSVNDIEEDVLKIALYNDEDSEKNIYPLFKHFEPNYKVKVSGKHWLDISHELANKGHALELLKNMYNIHSEETLVFGDYDNDIEMLTQSTFSFAMENANSNIKQIAAYETKSNNHFGVESILEKLIEAKKR